MPGALYCPGDLSSDGGVPVCSNPWEIQPVSLPFDPSQLDPAQLGVAFGAGFTLVTAFLVFGLGVRVLLNFIKTL
ncbi:ssDNA binding protein [Pseudomonas phage PMBT54]|nr:ssDNA binding protein [Pseudomonas phage PMBT54]